MIHRMTFYELHLSGEPGDDPETRQFSTTEIHRDYTQPFHLWLRYLAYHYVWEKISQPVYEWLEPRRRAKHEAGCDDCWPPEESEALWCGFMSRSSMQDIRCHDFQMAQTKFTGSERKGGTRVW